VGLRETISRNQTAVVAITCIVIVGAVIAIIVHARDFGPASVGDSYFTDDDGTTFYAATSTDDLTYGKDGQPLVRAHVFECGGKRVVGYLSRFPPESVKIAQEAKADKAAGRPLNVAKVTSIARAGIEIKRPGEKTWVKDSDAVRASQIRKFKCPDGSTPTEVFP
jgi:hypothetical protein